MTAITPALLWMTIWNGLNNVDPRLIAATLSGQVTYPGIGTFTVADFWDPINRPVVMLPQCPETINTLFALYTRTNPNNGQPLRWNDTTSITASNFDGTKPTKFIVPGFIDDPNYSNWQESIRDKFLNASDSNVIIVSWSGGNFNDYIQVC